jgi:hypothetical protein
MTMQTRTRSKIQKNGEAAPGTEAPAEGQTPEGGTPPVAATGTEAPAGKPAEANTNGIDLDALEARVDAALNPEAGIEKEMTKAEFEAYVESEIEAASKEDKEVAQKRLTALKSNMALAKASFAGATEVPVKITTYKVGAPSTLVVPAKEAQPSSGTSNVGFNIETAKRAVALAKHLRDDSSSVRTTLAKSAEGKVVIAKAGEAAKMLDGIAGLFGVSATNCEGEYYGLGWKVSDVIRAVEDAARVENAMMKLASVLGGAAAPAPAPAAEPVEAAATTPEDDDFAPGGAVVPAAKSAVKKGATPVVDDLFTIPSTGIKNADGWPMDMNAATPIQKSGKAQNEEITF